jgi:hypothetical protein
LQFQKITGNWVKTLIGFAHEREYATLDRFANLKSFSKFQHINRLLLLHSFGALEDEGQNSPFYRGAL